MDFKLTIFLLMIAIANCFVIKTPAVGNHLTIGECSPEDKVIYFDNVQIENDGNSILNGTLEVFVDAPVKISCIKVFDQVKDGTGAVPSLHSGGVGLDWVKITVESQFGKGLHFHIYVLGVRTMKSDKENMV